MTLLSLCDEGTQAEDEDLHCTDMMVALGQGRRDTLCNLFQKYGRFGEDSVIGYLGIVVSQTRWHKLKLRMVSAFFPQSFFKTSRWHCLIRLNSK